MLLIHQKPGDSAFENASYRNDAGPPNPAAVNTSALSLRLLAEAFFRYPVRILGTVSVTIVVTILAIFFMPKRYQATMQLLVLNTRENSVISPSDALVKPMSDVTDADVNSQAELLRSRDVLNGALDQLGKPPAPELLRDKAIETLTQNLDIVPVRQSNILNVSYVDSSPAAAKRTLQALASSFVEKELALRRPLHGQEFFLQLVDSNRRDLAEAEQNLADFKISTGIASLTDTEAALLRQVEGSTNQSAELTAALAEEQRRFLRTQDELRLHPERISTLSRSTPNQRAVEDLTTKLVELENRRTALLTGYQPTERNVQEVDHQIATVREEIARQRELNATEVTTDINPLAQELKGQLAKAEIASSALAARRRSVEAQRSNYVEQLDRLEGNAAKYEDLQKRVVEAQRNVDLAEQKRDQAAFEDALDRERILNVAFAAKPSSSSIPVQPRPRLYLALGLFTAIFLAVGLCMLSETTRQTVYTAAELEQLTGVMTIASVPFVNQPGTHTLNLRENAYIADTEFEPGRRQIEMQPFVARSKNS